MGPLYGYLASGQDMAALDPGKSTRWNLRPYDMVTNDANLLIQQVDEAAVPPLWESGAQDAGIQMQGLGALLEAPLAPESLTNRAWGP